MRNLQCVVLRLKPEEVIQRFGTCLRFSRRSSAYGHMGSYRVRCISGVEAASSLNRRGGFRICATSGDELPVRPEGCALQAQGGSLLTEPRENVFSHISALFDEGKLAHLERVLCDDWRRSIRPSPFVMFKFMYFVPLFYLSFEGTFAQRSACHTHILSKRATCDCQSNVRPSTWSVLMPLCQA